MRTAFEENISTVSCFQIDSCGAESFGKLTLGIHDFLIAVLILVKQLLHKSYRRRSLQDLSQSTRSSSLVAAPTSISRE
jgi:hypothetical protein